MECCVFFFGVKSRTLVKISEVYTNKHKNKMKLSNEDHERGRSKTSTCNHFHNTSLIIFLCQKLWLTSRNTFNCIHFILFCHTIISCSWFCQMYENTPLHKYLLLRGQRIVIFESLEGRINSWKTWHTININMYNALFWFYPRFHACCLLLSVVYYLPFLFTPLNTYSIVCTFSSVENWCWRHWCCNVYYTQSEW